MNIKFWVFFFSFAFVKYECNLDSACELIKNIRATLPQTVGVRPFNDSNFSGESQLPTH